MVFSGGRWQVRFEEVPPNPIHSLRLVLAAAGSRFKQRGRAREALLIPCTPYKQRGCISPTVAHRLLGIPQPPVSP